MPPGRRRRSGAGALAIALTVGIALGSGCSGDAPPPQGAEPFCDELRASGLVAMEIVDPAGATATAARFEQLGPSVPVDIRDEWRRLTELFRTVGSLDPTDTGFRADVLAEVGRTTTAATEVTSWVQRRCDVDLTAAAAPAAPAPATAPTGG